MGSICTSVEKVVKISYPKYNCCFQISGKFCSILYVRVFLKILTFWTSNYFWKFERLKRLNEKNTWLFYERLKHLETPPPPFDSLMLKFVFHNFYLIIFPYSISSFDCIWIAFSFAFFSDKPFINDSKFFNLQLPPWQTRISNSNTEIMQENTCDYYVLFVFQLTLASFIYYSEAVF